mgnify:FL=1
MSAKEKFMNKMSENGWNAKRLIEGLWTLEKGKINYEETTWNIVVLFV